MSGRIPVPKREFPDWMYQYPDTRNMQIKALAEQLAQARADLEEERWRRRRAKIGETLRKVIASKNEANTGTRKRRSR